MGLLGAADVFGFALFQLMQVHSGTVDGAATQIVMMLTLFCYMPALGIALAGWIAALIYICCLDTMLFLRWRSGAWRRVVLPLR